MFGNYLSEARAVFLDKDGVLFDAHTLCRKLHCARRELLEKQYGPLVSDLYDETMGVSESIQDDGVAMMASLDDATVLMAHVIHRRFPHPWEVCKQEATIITYQADAKVNLDEIPMLPGAFATLQDLKAHGFVVGLITGDQRERTFQQLQLWHIHEFMDVIVTSDDVQRQKPDAQGLLIALQMTQTRVEEAIMVGDSPNDWLMAESAGVPAIAISSKTNVISDNTIKATIPDLRSVVCV